MNVVLHVASCPVQSGECIHCTKLYVYSVHALNLNSNFISNTVLIANLTVTKVCCTCARVWEKGPLQCKVNCYYQSRERSLLGPGTYLCDKTTWVYWCMAHKTIFWLTMNSTLCFLCTKWDCKQKKLSMPCTKCASTVQYMYERWFKARCWQPAVC